MELPSVIYQRFRGDAIEVRKYFHGLYNVDICQSFLPLSNSNELVMRGHCLKVRKRAYRMQLRANYFSCKGQLMQ